MAGKDRRAQRPIYQKQTVKTLATPKKRPQHEHALRPSRLDAIGRLWHPLRLFKDKWPKEERQRGEFDFSTISAPHRLAAHFEMASTQRNGPSAGQGYRMWPRSSKRKASSHPARLSFARRDVVSGGARATLRARRLRAGGVVGP